jgi:O-antigen/teichoic acid export membrane protein
MSGRKRQVAGRAAWGVADQALSSLTNFAVGVFVARELGPADFGAFSLAFATYLVALNASRGLATDPLVVRFSDASSESWRRAASAATATSLLVGAAVSIACVLATGVLEGAAETAFLSLGVVLPGLMLQDSWRYVFFAAGRARDAFINDLAWAIFIVPFITAVVNLTRPQVQWFVIAWGGAAALAGLVGIAQARVRPRMSLVRHWFIDHRDLGVRYLGENTSFSAAGQLRLYGLGAVAGLTAVGALRGAELLLGPVNLIIMGVGSLMAVPEASRLVRRDVRRFKQFIIALGLLLTGASVLWGLAIGLLLPASVGVWLLGATWDPAAALLLPITLMVALLGVWSSAWTGLRAMGAAQRSLRAQIVGASAFLFGALLGAIVNGAEGAAWGSAMGNLVASCFWWQQLHRALRELQAGRAVAPSVPAHAHGS